MTLPNVEFIPVLKGDLQLRAELGTLAKEMGKSWCLDKATQLTCKNLILYTLYTQARGLLNCLIQKLHTSMGMRCRTSVEGTSWKDGVILSGVESPVISCFALLGPLWRPPPVCEWNQLPWLTPRHSGELLVCGCVFLLGSEEDPLAAGGWSVCLVHEIKPVSQCVSL